MTSVSNPIVLEPRSYDGSGNNVAHPTWAKAHEPIVLRHGEPDPSRFPGSINARAISNIACLERAVVPDPYGRSNMVWAWGQFLDHELDLVMDGDENRPIKVPADDPQYRRGATIPFPRSKRDEQGQLRNVHSSYVDGADVYGTSSSHARALRTLAGDGKLQTSGSPYQADLLPRYEQVGLPVSNARRERPDAFVAGDERVNEHAVLTSMHTLFVREHNRRCDELRAADPDLRGEELYQRARHWVIGLMQVITFGEFVPALLGPGTFVSVGRYDPEVDSTVSLDFATVAFRVGHTMLPRTIHAAGLGRLERLRDLFFDPRLVEWHGIEPWLGGLPTTPMSAIDNQVTDGVRDFLFAFEGHLIDLASLNIQRGRDHGMPAYNELRARWGLGPAADFADISDDAKVVDGLRAAYGSVDEIDPWVGALAEQHEPGRRVGPLLFAILEDQFVRLRDGDRFAWNNDPNLTEDERHHLATVRLADVMRWNLHGDTSWVPSDVFHLSH
ncbi:MAG: peroxidase family protein [Actinomycetota bacterium]|nr:peroxidase family protein [Actinomycetota bacterium]